MPNTFDKMEGTTWPIPNYWDIIAIIIVVGFIVLLGWVGKSMVGHYRIGQTIPISLDYIKLPYYALRTVVRLLVAMFFAVLSTFIFGTWAAKSAAAERIIIPIIDVLQSVPVLGFLTIAVVGFLVLFRGSMLGPESAAIFAIFTAQVWNMIFSLYSGLRMVPEDLKEAARMFHLNAWQTYWRIEVPYALPGLLWNTMMSMSGSWIFIVASEAITVANQNIRLPGIGSYIDLAIQKADVSAIIAVIITMVIVIVLYDQLLFRPLVAWAEKFKAETMASEDVPESWVLDIWHRTRLLRYISRRLSNVATIFLNLNFHKGQPVREKNKQYYGYLRWLYYAVLIVVVPYCGWLIFGYAHTNYSWKLIGHVFVIGIYTALRVAVAIVVSTVIWVPLGVKIGLNPRLAQRLQPVIQCLAAFPANLIFPLVVMFIVKFHLNVNIWAVVLMILGTQWYILFNIIAGTMALPRNLHYAVDTLCISKTLWWQRFILPGIAPYYVTGAITAAGGAWNISIIAEVIDWGQHHFRATGLGSYIELVGQQGRFADLVLGIVIMSLLVLIINRVIWRPLYRMVEEKYAFS